MNYKGKIDQIFICEFCNKEFKFKGYSFNHKFCSLKCVHARNKKLGSEREEQRYLNWISGLKLDIVNPRPTMKTFVMRRDGYKCAVCSITEWNNKPITLWLDHIEGDASNNLPNNLRLICPNCDSQSDTFGAKNYGKGRKSRGMKQYG